MSTWDWNRRIARADRRQEIHWPEVDRREAERRVTDVDVGAVVKDWTAMRAPLAGDEAPVCGSGAS